MLNCIILDDYQNVALSFGNWNTLKDSVTVSLINRHITQTAELIAILKNYEIIVIMRERTVFDKELLLQLPKLKLLITTGMRNSSIDLAQAKAQGVIVSGTRSFSEPPAELTWALIHALSRHLIDEVNTVRGCGWQHTIGFDLYRKHLGLLGFGKIGRQVSRVAKAFGMTVSAWSENLTEEAVSSEGVLLAPSKDDLLIHSDIISIHLVLGERTANLIGRREFELMKRTALLINTSRSGIVDQAALLDSLNTGCIRAAASDVYDIEPLPEGHLFRKLKNFLPTPHIGYVTERNYQAYYSDAVENIKAYLDGCPVRVIN